MKVNNKFGTSSMDDEISEVKFDMVDDDDDILMQADDESFGEQMEEKENETEVDLAGINFDEEMEDDEVANISVGVGSNTLGGNHDSGASGFDGSTGKLWIYPTNYPVRDYQYNIVQQALYKNTLVVLPTGLGKTFIAAVLMYNFFRWFPQGKIVFMAPTKPLVAQQIQACYNIMGIPKADTVEMTGTMSPALRQKAWRQKRVVFLTPQVMTNDLSRGSVTAESIKCLVLDEAHKALGNHAYCQVVRELIKFTREFRILALSATPGSDLKAVQQMMNNLLISHIELRSEESIDIRPYTHERKIDKIVVPLGEELSGLKLQYIQVMTCIVQRLIRNRVLYNREATKLSKFLLLKARDEFRQNPPENLQQFQYGNIEADFAMAISVYHGFELLQLHGLRSLYNYLTGIIVGEKGYGRTRSELLRNADFNHIMENLKQKFSGTSSHGVSSESGDSKVVVGHPKMQRLEEIVVDHFKTYEKKGEATRVMIFSQYRDSVQEIATILNQHQPLIKVMPFIGQSSAGKSSKGYTQKEQLMVMQQFREGGYNTLVSTCVGEEGLDIGDVDLIVCFDAHKSPIRLVQRMGRTGRKRQGRIVMLVAEGKEEQIYNQSLYSKKTIHKAILNGAKSLHFYPGNPRMLPSSVTPQCHKMHITVAAESKKATKTSSKNKAAQGSKNTTISGAFGKQVKKIFEDECLTAEEYAEIKDEFSVLSATGKQLSKPRCVILKSDTQNDFLETNSHVINFSEWLPWQNSLQSTHMIGHSSQTVNLVKTSEFIELQRCIGDEEDHYGLEMSKWLKEKDTENGIQRSEKQISMHSFFTNSQDKSNTSEKDKLHPGDGQRKKNSKSASKQTEQVVVNTITDTILVGSDSSLDGGQEMTSATEHVKPKVSKLFTELGHSNDTSNKRSPNGIKRRSRRKKTESNKPKKLDTKLAVQKKGQAVKKKKLSGTNQDVTSKLRKRSFLKLLETNIPSTKDSDDFEVDGLGNRRSWVDTDDEKITCNKEAHEDNVTVKNNVTLSTHFDLDVSNNDNPECQYLVPSAIESCGNKIQTQDIPECHTNMCRIKETCTDSQRNVGFCITKPPPVSGVRELFQSLKSGKEFKELDLEELMEQWNELGRDACHMTAGQQKLFMLAEKRPGSQFLTTSQTAGDTFEYETNLSSCTGDFNEEVCAKHKKSIQVKPQTSVGKLFVTETRQSIISTNSENCKSADDLVKEDTPMSPLFKRLLNKTVHINKQTPDRLPKFREKMVTPGEEQQTDFCKVDPESCRFDDSFIENCAQKTMTVVQHVLSSKEMANISVKESSDTVMKSFMDEEEMDINCSKNIPVSSVNFHESFVTFTQAMECLQTSSEETVEVLCSSPPCRNTSRSNISSQQSHFHKTPSSTIMKSRIELTESTPHSVRIRDQYSEHTAQNFIHTDAIVPSAACISGNSATELSVKASKVSVQDCLAQNLQSDKEIEQRSNNQSSLDHLTETPVTGCSSNKLELPHFDLGFDFDDDDDDIIPPTPPKLSQESVFGLKTFTMDKNSLQETRTLSLSDVDKAPVSVRSLSRDPPAASPPASAASDGTGGFEPFMSTFDLQMLSDDSLEMPREICEEPTKNPEANTKTQQREHLFYSNQVELGSEKCNRNKTVSLSVDETDFHGLPLLTKSECNKTISLKSSLPSPPKKKKLSFNECDSVSKTENNTAKSDVISSSEGREFSDETSPSHSTKFKAGKLWLGKRHVQETINDKSVNAVVTDHKVAVWQKHESLETSLQAGFKSLSDFDEMNDCNKDLCQDTSFYQMQVMPGSLSNSPFNPASVCKTPEATSTLSHMEESPKVCGKPAHMEESPKVCGKPAYDAVVKASTPIRDVAEGYARHSVVDGVEDINMSELTPIRAKKDENKLDSGDGSALQRKKRVKALDFSSDQDPLEDPTSASMEDITKARVLTIKQTEACNMKQVNKSLLESISDSFDDDDLDDFKVNHRVIMEPEQSTKKKKIKKKPKMGAVFIEEEAEVSGDDESSDEQEDINDFYESSFIDNNTVMTQTQGTDMRAVYLKSIKSPVLAKPANYCRMQYNPKRKQEDIFSQALPEDEGLSEYEEDSFCVGSAEEDIIYTEEESLLEHRQKRINKPKTGQRQKGKKRIHMMADTSSDEEKESHIQMTQEFSIHPCKFGRKVLLSSSEDERSMSKKTDASLSHLEATNSAYLEKSCKNVPKVKCGTDSVTGQNLAKNTSDFLEQSMGYEKINRNGQQVSNQHPSASNIGNFDLLGETDWFDDFDVSEPDSVNINASETPLVKETKKSDSERRFLRLTYTTDISSDVKNIRPLAESASYSSNDDSGVRWQENSFKYCASSSFTNVKKQVCDNTRDPPKLVTYVSNKPLCNKTRDLDKFSERDSGIKYETGHSIKGNMVTSTSISHSSSSKTTTHGISGDSGGMRSSADVDTLDTSLLNINSVKPPSLMTREERLRRQKEKQEMYRQKLQKVQQMNSSLSSPIVSTSAASAGIPETNCVNVDIPFGSHDPAKSDVCDVSSHGQVSPVFTKLLDAKRTGHQLQVLVDSREISGAQEIISALRLKHGITVTARQLTCCDYILSNQLAADRIQWSSFSNSSCRSKLSSRLCEMQAVYERCVLIVEADKVKAGQEKSKKSLHRTKYLDTTLSYLMQSKIRVYFTDSVEETAAMLADLCNVEDKKGRAISVPSVLSSAKEEMFRFVLSMPRVTVPQALNLAHKFRSVTELLSSPPGVIQERGCMTMDSAQSLHHFLRHRFDIQMIPGSKR